MGHSCLLSDNETPPNGGGTVMSRPCLLCSGRRATWLQRKVRMDGMVLGVDDIRQVGKQLNERSRAGPETPPFPPSSLCPFSLHNWSPPMTAACTRDRYPWPLASSCGASWTLRSCARSARGFVSADVPTTSRALTTWKRPRKMPQQQPARCEGRSPLSPCDFLHGWICT